jgi:hypothetical protein
MVFDRTCVGGLGLSHIWAAGGWLYGRLDRLDRVFAATSWAEALEWLATCRPERPVAEIQIWGHGKWGRALIGTDGLDSSSLGDDHPHRPLLEAIRARLLPARGQALWWFRCCETFGALEGLRFARAWADFLGCRVAGHTYIIGFHQSGLHSLLPGASPTWPAMEGLRRGTPDTPEEALPSRPWAPNTITCLHGQIPAGF